MSGGNFATSLLQAGVIDEIGLNIHPLLLGAGPPAFLDPGARVQLELTECRQLDGGCVFVQVRGQAVTTSARRFELPGSAARQHVAAEALDPQAADERERGARHHHVRRRGRLAGVADQRRRHQRRGAAEDREADVEDQRHAGEADARRKEIRQQHRERSVGQARAESRPARTAASGSIARDLERAVERQREHQQQRDAGAQQVARRNAIAQPPGRRGCRSPTRSRRRSARTPPGAGRTCSTPGEIRRQVREEQAVEAAGAGKQRAADQHVHEVRPQQFA